MALFGHTKLGAMDADLDDPGRCGRWSTTELARELGQDRIRSMARGAVS